MNEVEERLAKVLRTLGIPSEQADIHAMKAPPGVREEMSGLTDEEAIDYSRGQICGVTQRLNGKPLGEASADEAHEAFDKCFRLAAHLKEFEDGLAALLKAGDKYPDALVLAAAASMLLNIAASRCYQDRKTVAILLVGVLLYSDLDMSVVSKAVECFED
jgi:hypothetical protein